MPASWLDRWVLGRLGTIPELLSRSYYPGAIILELGFDYHGKQKVAWEVFADLD